jgi:hypothetical protein
MLSRLWDVIIMGVTSRVGRDVARATRMPSAPTENLGVDLRFMALSPVGAFVSTVRYIGKGASART